MNMDSGVPPINRIWQAIQAREETVAAFTNEGNTWLEEHPAIRARINLLTANQQTEENVEALTTYIKSEAHPAALYALWMVKDLTTNAGLPLAPTFQFVRGLFAAGYRQALRDAMEEEIVV